MKRFITIAILVTLLPYSAAMSQNGRCNAIIGKLADGFTKGGGAYIEFVSTTTAGNNMVQKITGNMTIKGEKFAMRSNVMDMGFDGKTAWSYIKGSDEINLSEPTKEELLTINPYILLNNYQSMYRAEYKGKSGNNEQITFTPVSTGGEIKSATVSIDAGRSCPTRLEIVNRDASKTVITINKYEARTKNDDSIFVFSKKDYPNTEIIDLR